jgi:hypothetical protein
MCGVSSDKPATVEEQEPQATLLLLVGHSFELAFGEGRDGSTGRHLLLPCAAHPPPEAPLRSVARASEGHVESGDYAVEAAPVDGAA